MAFEDLQAAFVPEINYENLGIVRYPGDKRGTVAFISREKRLAQSEGCLQRKDNSGDRLREHPHVSSAASQYIARRLLANQNLIALPLPKFSQHQLLEARRGALRPAVGRRTSRI